MNAPNRETAGRAARAMGLALDATKSLRWSYSDSYGEWRMVLRPDGVRLTWMVGRDYIVETIRHAPPAGPLEFRNAMTVAEFAAEYGAAEDAT